MSAVELGPYGIRVNYVAPGAIETERTRAEAPDYAETWGRVAPLRRVGTPADIAGPVLFLAGPQAAYVTGQTLWVDGGVFTRAFIEALSVVSAARLLTGRSHFDEGAILPLEQPVGIVGQFLLRIEGDRPDHRVEMRLAEGCAVATGRRPRRGLPAIAVTAACAGRA